MSPQQLVAYAITRSVKLNRAQAAAIIAHHRHAAPEQISRAGALIDLAGALGRNLDLGGALVHLERHHEDYDQAAESLVYEIRNRQQQVFNVEFTRLEKLYWSRDAKARHAAFTAELSAGALGWQASMLLLAAEDAGLTKPDARAYRKALATVVGDEMGRRFPTRPEAEWNVVDAEYGETLERVTGSSVSPHDNVIRTAMRDEQTVRELVTNRNPELAQKIGALRSQALVKDVTRILDKIRRRLEVQADQGWVVDIERYREHVIEAARHHALQAA